MKDVSMVCEDRERKVVTRKSLAWEQGGQEGDCTRQVDWLQEKASIRYFTRQR
jgi:hypothetical protein